MGITPAVRQRAVVVLALLAVRAPGSASRPLPALPFYTGHALAQSLAEYATLSTQQAGHNAELFSQHHGANTGLLQDITGHWSGFPHQAHPSDHYNLEHQLSHLQLQGPHHSAEHPNPTFGHEAGSDGTLFSIPFAQNQYPTAQQPSLAQVSNFVAHPQATLGNQYYHQGFPAHSSDYYYRHLHQGQHWQEQGGHSDSPNHVKLEPLREALGSPPRHLQV
ncbi:hypothetical protein ACQY0O_001500 [Thecaphora frezii]